ncbi:rhamnan synthesis F family protein [Alteromonas gilva]|uniref:Rhamnan synthesis F family protein n=1 Tax=Alteromonas gilva TaxID=2987522 RepID=A0ABT5LA13_9ALTE|nr:rhamnan synthesis F family protein [Alteromonas gilva]MDC8833017.1 rhamnan synthesis F family protein [Alteromonas gilva]
MVKHTDRPFLLVSGFHRSGTSLVAKTLANNGVNMGDNLMGASFANPEGHFEDIPLVELHDAMLAANGTNWQEHKNITLTTPSFLTSRLTTYLNSRRDKAATFIGAKDPRALFFRQQWLQQRQANLKSLFVFRSWQYSVSSLLKRHSRELLQTSSPMSTRPSDIIFWQQPELAAKMWITSAQAMLKWHEKNPNNTLLFPLAALIEKNDHLPKALQSIGLPEDLLDASSIIKKELLHTDVPSSLLNMLPEAIQNECNNLSMQLDSVFGINVREQITYTQTNCIFPDIESLISSDEGGAESESEPASYIDLTRFTYQEAISLITEYPVGLYSFDWTVLLNAPGITAKDYDDIFTCAIKYKAWTTAELAVRRALDLQPASWRWMQLGDIFKRKGDIDQAERCYKNALARTPENATFYARLAEVEIERKNFDAARKLITEAKALDITKPAIASAEVILHREESVKLKSDSAPDDRADYQSMALINNYAEVVDVMSATPQQGKALDDYMVKTAFVLRDNYQWLKEGLTSIPAQSKQSLLDYLSNHVQKYWSEAVISTEFSRGEAVIKEPLVPSKPQSEKAKCTIGVHIHVFYPYLLPEIFSFLENIPCAFSTVVTCPKEIEAPVKHLLSKLSDIRVISVENKGRDIAPWLMVASKLLKHCTVVLKLHTKSTPHASKLSGWRLQLLWHLLESPQSIEKILSDFAENPRLGLVIPAYHPHIFPHINWGKNKALSEEIANIFNIPVDTTISVNAFPAGSMFWYRPAALAPIIEHTWQLKDFPDERGQIDGTLMHAIERLIPYICHNQHYVHEFINLPSH